MSNLHHREFIWLCSEVGSSRVHKCEHCPYFSKSIFSMRSHSKRHCFPMEIFSCEKNQLEKFRCGECNFKTEIFMFLRKHLKEVHVSDNISSSYILKSYVCKKCPFLTFSLLHWFKHLMNNNYCGNNMIEYHSNGLSKDLQTLNQFNCDQCAYKTTKKSYLKVHKIHKHTSEENINWFKCDQCSYKSKHKHTLKIHNICKHTSEQDISWFKCDHCSYKAKQKFYIKVHKMRKHTPDEDINWVKCDECSYKSKQKFELKIHKTRHHD